MKAKEIILNKKIDIDIFMEIRKDINEYITPEYRHEEVHINILREKDVDNFTIKIKNRHNEKHKEQHTFTNIPYEEIPEILYSILGDNDLYHVYDWEKNRILTFFINRTFKYNHFLVMNGNELVLTTENEDDAYKKIKYLFIDNISDVIIGLIDELLDEAKNNE